MLRGTIVQNGEYYSAKYYDIVPKRDNEGKIVYKNNNYYTYYFSKTNILKIYFILFIK